MDKKDIADIARTVETVLEKDRKVNGYVPRFEFDATRKVLADGQSALATAVGEVHKEVKQGRADTAKLSIQLVEHLAEAAGIEKEENTQSKRITLRWLKLKIVAKWASVFVGAVALSLGLAKLILSLQPSTKEVVKAAIAEMKQPDQGGLDE